MTETTSYPCTRKDCDYEGTSPQGLGAHRRFAHGIKGKTTKKAKKPSAVSADEFLAQHFPKGIPLPKVDLLVSWKETTNQLLD